MKRTFSRSWISSSKPRKQVKYRENAPLHIKQKFVAAHLSSELKRKYHKRSVPLRTGDKVKIMRGDHKGKTGKILRVNLKKMLVYLEGFQASKIDGSKADLSFAPSNLMITELVLDDKRRKESIEGNHGSR